MSQLHLLKRITEGSKGKYTDEQKFLPGLLSNQLPLCCSYHRLVTLWFYRQKDV